MYRLSHFVLSAMLCLLMAACRGNDVPTQGFCDYIKACTGGVIADNSAIRIEFNSPYGADAADCDCKSLLSFSPSVKGECRWVDDRTLEFLPGEGALKPGKEYEGRLRLDRLTKVSDKSLKVFHFDFTVARKDFSLELDRLLIENGSPEFFSVSGVLRSSCGLEEEKLREALKWDWREEGGSLACELSADGKSCRFTVSQLRRIEEKADFRMMADASVLGFGKKKEAVLPIAGSDEFTLCLKSLESGEENCVDLMFSEALDASQNPDGLFTVVEAGRWYCQKDGNRIRIYFGKNDSGQLHVNLSSAIRSESGRRLASDIELCFDREENWPAVALRREGNILPDPSDLSICFSARQLNAIDLSIVRIYEDNILSFLQDNGLDGNEMMRRSGRLVYRGKVRLDGDPSLNLHGENLFKLNLSGVMKKEAGAIYVVRLSFRKEYSLYGKDASQGEAQADGTDTMISLDADNGLSEADEAVWDCPWGWYYEDFCDWSKYEWKDRNDPSKDSFYMDASRFPQTTLLSSNIGIIAKSQDGKRVWVTVNDILSGEPLGGAEIYAYNFQKQRIGSARTDRDGCATINADGKVWAVTARSGKSTGYLKMQDGYENSTSRFDVGGKTVSRGLKGYIYGERGVWRPGDTLHLTLIVDDLEHKLPENHPVTMEVYTPSGQFYERIVDSEGRDGFHHFKLITDANDPTGSWNAYFKLGGSSFHKTLHIEELKANRLKLKLNVDRAILQSGQNAGFSLGGEWLTGPPASGLKARVEMKLSRLSQPFPEFKEYVFTDPSRDFAADSHTLLERTLDEAGQCKAETAMPYIKGAPGMLKAELVSRVFEAGGDASISTMSLPFSPYRAYVGLKLPQADGNCLETDRDNEFRLVVLDPEGRRIDGHSLEYSIYKMDWNWWLQDDKGGYASYVNGNSANRVAGGVLETEGGEAVFKWRLDYPDWGRYFIYVKDLDGRHACGCEVTVDWPQWRGRADREDPDAASLLSISTDRNSCKAGEELTLFIPAAKDGRALVSIENSRGVLSRSWVETGEEETRHTIKVSGEMAPNFYICVSLLQPYSKRENDAPLRMYGIKAISVDDENSRLQPVINAPEVIRPQEEFKLKVSESSGRPMSYTIAIVDEGLLDITSFKTPDPWGAMHAKEALGVKTWDLYDKVVGAFDAQMAAPLSIGGDESIEVENMKDRRFNPVVRFLGPFTLEKGSATHRIKLPMYVGSVRIMVVAGHDGAFGSAEKSVPVRNPLMLLASLPESLGCGESIKLPVNVFAMEEGISEVRLSLKAEGPVELGDSRAALKFSSSGDKIASFSLKAGNSSGKARIYITAEGGGKKVSEVVELDIVKRNPVSCKVDRRILEPGDSCRFEWQAEETLSAGLQLAGFPCCDFEAVLDFAKAYPYDCTSQLAARGLAALSVMDAVREERRAEAETLAGDMLKRIYSRQLANGGFCNWPGMLKADEMTTSLVGEFLLKADGKGIRADKGVMSSWKNFQKKCSVNFRNGSAVDMDRQIQAYRLYTLALAGSPDESAMNRLRSEGQLQGSAAWRLASAYCLSGKKSIAKDLIAKAGISSNAMAKAVMLGSLVLCDEVARAGILADEVASYMDNGWNTELLACSADALAALAEKMGNEVLEAEVDGQLFRSADALCRCNPARESGSCLVVNRGKGSIRATLKLETDGELKEEAASGLRLERRFLGADGKTLDPSLLKQGEDFYIYLKVSNLSGKMLNGLALSQSIASGWEIFNERLYGITESAEDCSYYKDIRNGRCDWFFNLAAGQSAGFRLRLQASYAGDYILPAASCRSMEEEYIFANTASGRCKVR